MRFLHTADWHVGASKFLGADYLERQLGVYDRIIELAIDRKIDTVVVAGDIFDSDEPLQVERDEFLKRVLAYDRMGIRLLVIKGNHDQGNTDRRTAIRYLAHLTDQGVFQHSIFTERTQYVRVGDTIFVLLCHNPRYFKQETDEALRKLRGSIAPPHKHLVLVCHEAIRGAVSDTNYRMKDGDEVPVLDVGEDVSDNAEITYTAVGDIHIMQRLAPRTYYCGAPMQVKFGDQYPKGVLVVDTDNPDNPEFVPIESKRLVKVVAANLESVDVPDDAYTKLVATPALVAEAREAGLLDGVVRYEAVKQDVAIEYKANMDLPGRVYSGLEQLLQGDDLHLGKREAAALFHQVGL